MLNKDTHVDRFWARLTRFLFFGLLGGLPFIAGCSSVGLFSAGMATPSVISSVVTPEFKDSSSSESKTFNGNYKQAWKTTLSVLKEEEYVIQSSDRESGLLSTDYVRISGDRLEDVTEESQWMFSYGRYKLSFYFTHEGARSVRIKVTAVIEGFSRLQNRMKMIPSNGKLEQSILDNIEYSRVLDQHALRRAGAPGGKFLLTRGRTDPFSF